VTEKGQGKTIRKGLDDAFLNLSAREKERPGDRTVTREKKREERGEHRRREIALGQESSSS